MKTTVALLDLDGVLIWPRGYRASVNASMKYLVDKMGLNIETPVEEIAPLFEALGITCEWDMLALLTTILLDAAAAQSPHVLPALGLREILDWVRGNAPDKLQVDFTEAVRLLAPHLAFAPVPSESVFLAREKVANLYPHLDHQPFVSELLRGTRDLETSFTSMLFQNIVLGDAVFENIYSHPVILPSLSLLQQHDEPALLPEIAERLQSLWEEGRLNLSVFTARPSLPPRDANVMQKGYSPEAEMAVELVGLRGIPIMGYGRLQWLAVQSNVVPDSFLKPAPVQALAALRAAITHEESGSLTWAKGVESGMFESAADELPGEIELHVFEDSAIGLTAAKCAAEILKPLGIDVELHCWGVAKHPDKVAALQRAGALIFPDVNAAMRQAFGEML